ncbi:hypothetical protein EO244_07085 [Ancylomarina salipaludis]|uniref:Dinitrogenase iron-molybdenum cofactor biosynthesis domain-containing protein n=1 Tax=Ancylomarina salipaludis TaxID=2501299 RepID=A0A4Q1JNH5_9BACT|nr:NifB/NifX family molybdenum-iron cluster-binding protein [Ancylomarina salipaludis]RXQ95620.1 hypothetical protein EO244_07085 [Ancylomarina salipaludis]
MIAAIPVMSDTNEAQLSSKFARSPYFVLVDKSKKVYRFVKNPFANDEKGVGPKILTLLCQDNGVDAFIAFELGLKLQQLAKAKGLQFIILNENKKQLSDILKLMGID